MTQRPAGQLHHQGTTDPLKELERLLLGTPEERARRDREYAAAQEHPRQSLLEALAALTDEPEEPEPTPAPRYRMEDRPEDRGLIDAWRNRTRSERRVDHAKAVAKRRTAVIAVSASLLVFLGLPTIGGLMLPVSPSTPSVSSAPSAPAPSSTPTPTVTSAPGTLVRGTTDDGEPFAVVIPTGGPSFWPTLFAGVLIGMVTSVTNSFSAPLGEWMRRRLGLPETPRLTR